MKDLANVRMLRTPVVDYTETEDRKKRENKGDSVLRREGERERFKDKRWYFFKWTQLEIHVVTFFLVHNIYSTEEFQEKKFLCNETRKARHHAKVNQIYCSILMVYVCAHRSYSSRALDIMYAADNEYMSRVHGKKGHLVSN